MAIEKLRYWIWVFISIAIMAGDNLNANPGILTHADVEQYYESEQKRIGVSAGKGLYAPVLNGHNIIHNITSGFKWVANGLFNKNVDFKIAEEIRKGTLHATITDPTLVGAINTDINASQEWETIKKKEYSATIPLDMLTQSGREEIKQNLEEIADVYDDIKQKHFDNHEHVHIDSTDADEKKKEAIKAGFTEEEIEEVAKLLPKKKITVGLATLQAPEGEEKNVIWDLENLDNYKLLLEKYGGEENIPEGYIEKLASGKYYYKDSNLEYDSGPEYKKMHKGMVQAANYSSEVMEVARVISEKYGKPIEYGMYLATILTGGGYGAAINIVKSAYANKILSEHLDKGAEIVIESIKEGIRSIDPYLSEESATNLAVAAAAVASATLSTGSNNKYALNLSKNNKYTAPKNNKHDGVNYNKNSSGSDGTKNNSANSENKAWKKNPSKSESEVWQNFKHHKKDIKTNGLKGKDERFYKWDYTHNDIEVYNGKGKHLGSQDPVTGEMYKPAVIGRTIKDEL